MGMEEKNMFTKKGVHSKTHVLTSLVVPFYLFFKPFLTKPTHALGHHTSLLSFSSERRASFHPMFWVAVSCRLPCYKACMSRQVDTMHKSCKPEPNCRNFSAIRQTLGYSHKTHKTHRPPLLTFRVLSSHLCLLSRPQFRAPLLLEELRLSRLPNGPLEIEMKLRLTQTAFSGGSSQKQQDPTWAFFSLIMVQNC